MAKTWKPKVPKGFQPYRPPKFEDIFKESNKKKEIQPHVVTEYEKKLIAILCPVIKNKQLIRFWYKDDTTDFEDWRIIEPHLIGQTKFKTASVLLSGWFLPTTEQIINGHEQDWKNYKLDGVQKIEVLPQRFRFTRPGYNSRDSRMQTIFCATL